MSDPVIAAVVQMTSGPDVRENLARASALVRKAASRGARLIVLPENVAYFGDEAGKHGIAERFNPDELPAGIIGLTACALARASLVSNTMKSEWDANAYRHRYSGPPSCPGEDRRYSVAFCRASQPISRWTWSLYQRNIIAWSPSRQRVATRLIKVGMAARCSAVGGTIVPPCPP